MASPLEIWIDFASSYSYIAVSRVEGLARDAKVPLVWRPFLLGPVFQRQGFDSSPFVQQKDKGEYAAMDAARQARKHGLPWKHPTTFPRLAVQTLRVAAAFADEAPWVGPYCRRMLALNYAEDRNFDSQDTAREVLDALGEDGARIVAEAQTEPRKSRLRTFTDEAIARKVFGAPTFFVDGEMFWGNDRLEDAIAKARG